MYVCVCRGVTDGRIREQVAKHPTMRMRDLYRQLGVCSGCGQCAREVNGLLKETARQLQPWPLFSP